MATAAVEQLFTAASDGGSGYSRLFGQSASSYEYYYTILVYTKKRKGTSYGLGRPGAEHFYSPLLWGQPCNSRSISAQGQSSIIGFIFDRELG